MPTNEPVNHTGRKFGPFIAIEPAAKPRHWWLECPRGHVECRRIDNLLRVRPEVIRCTQCARKKPAERDPHYDLWQAFVKTLTPASKTTLSRILQTAR
jgi:hypothetical protein